MTNQEAFNKVWHRLVTQKDKGKCEVDLTYTKRCSYRSTTGDNCCAIGVLLTDETAKQLEEKFKILSISVRGIFDMSNMYPFKYPVCVKAAKELEGLDKAMLNELQIIHDFHYEEAELRLMRVAKKYSLTTPL
jgi:hypothetical protein